MGYFRNVKENFKLKYYLNYIIIAAFLGLMIVLNSTGMLNRSTLALLAQISYSIILAVSLNLVVGFLGELSLGHAGFMCVGAYIGCYVSNLLGKNIESDLLVIIISMLVGGCVAAVFGFIIGLPALRLKGDYLAIATLAFGEIVRNIFNNLELFGSASGYKTQTYNTKSLYVVGFVTVLIVLILTQNLIRSKHGRAITAIRDNEIAARAMGINVTMYKLLVFIIAAFFAGVSGTLYGKFTGIVLQTKFSYNYSIEILVMVVLGGMGNINGSIIAASLITWINVVLQDKLSGELGALKLIVYALILILVVLYNNAPAFRSIREKLSVSSFVKKLSKKNKKPETIKDDSAKWDRIPTKIDMDEILSVDIESRPSYKPDSPKGGKR